LENGCSSQVRAAALVGDLLRSWIQQQQQQHQHQKKRPGGGGSSSSSSRKTLTYLQCALLQQWD